MASPREIPLEVEKKAQALANKLDRRIGLYVGQDGKWHCFGTLHAPKGIYQYYSITPEIPADFGK